MDKRKLYNQIRDLCDKCFSDNKSEKELNDTYDTLRELIVCSMSDRAESIGLNPDEL